MLAESLDVVIGVDTHRDNHTLALVEARTGVLLTQTQLPANRAGYQEALTLGKRAGAARAWAIEGTGAYGAGLARYLTAKGEQVLEVERPTRPRGRDGRLKDDAIDALRGARTLLAGEAAAERERPGFCVCMIRKGGSCPRRRSRTS